jgi:hypothetical protein
MMRYNVSYCTSVVLPMQSGNGSFGKGLVPLFAGINCTSHHHRHQQQQQHGTDSTSLLRSTVSVLSVSTVYTDATATLHIRVTAVIDSAAPAAADTGSTDAGVVLTGLTVVSATDTLRYACNHLTSSHSITLQLFSTSSKVHSVVLQSSS